MKRFFALAVVVSGVAAQAGAVDLQGATVEAWQAYLSGVDARMQPQPRGGQPFMWIDETADRSVRLRRGETLVSPVLRGGVKPVPNGLIHHWIGAVFIPNATIESLLTVIHDYNRYKEIYKPVVIDSQSLGSGVADQEFSMTWERHVLFVNAALEGRYRVRDFVIDAHRGYSITETTRVQQIEDYGRPSEHLLPPDTGSGFVWRIQSVSRYEERDGGVYLEVEAIALTRDIPGSLRWMVTPVVNHLSVNSLTATLNQTRQAVGAQRLTLAMRGREAGKAGN